jgi:lysophospholipase L1-like esterase
MQRLTNLSRVAAFGAVLALAACESHKDLLGPATPAGGEIFRSYVALGNSITAGFQSNGINDSTQRQSYARLLSIQMGTQYHYAALAGRGCTPPIANGLTGALVGNAPPGTCDLRTASSVTDILNNVAVPGARVLDPTSVTSPASNPLTTFILGGKTQVEKALDAHPTFATIWIGNNDVLQPALSGLYQPIISSQTQFQTAYDAMISQLLAGAPDLKGVLIGVAQAKYLPSFSAGALLFASPGAQLAINSATGKTVLIDPSCNASSSLVNIPQIILAIRGGTHPPVIACAKGLYPAPVGDVYVLDPAEQVTLTAAVDAYNAYIQGKATAIGFAYYDPNVLFAAKRANGEIPPFPDFASSKATTATYGALISLDGVHPTAAAHKIIANELIGVINAKYQTSLQPVP